MSKATAMLSQLLALVLFLSGCSALTDGDVRLVNGGTPYQGRLEVYLGRRWGTVCDDGWGKANEDVVCRQLEYRPRSGLWHHVTYGAGSGHILMDDVICRAGQTRLTQCSYTHVHNCNHNEDVGVACGEVARCHPLRATYPLAVSISYLASIASMVATHTCPLGFTLQGSATRFCADSCTGAANCISSNRTTYWSGQAARCAPQTCEALCPPEFGYVVLPSDRNGLYEVNVTLLIRCEQGYELIGNQSRTCLKYRRWSGQTPICKPILCPPIRTPIGGWSVLGYNGTQQTTGCKSGFYGNRTLNHRVCVHGKWDGVELECRHFDCGSISSRFPLRTTYTNTTVGSVANHSCPWGFLLHAGNMTQTCQVECSYDVVDGRQRPMCTRDMVEEWSGTTPYCRHVCAGVTCSADKNCQPHPHLPRQHICVCKNESECPQASEPVCASNAMTYRHPCLATVDACHQNTTISIVATGPCLPASMCKEEQPSTQQPRTCLGTSTRYFFNPNSSRCESMLWSACFEGSNVFDTQPECQARCSEVDPCELTPVRGKCSNMETRFYFRGDTEQCLPFSYGGCYGNGNNFMSRQACTTCNNRCPVLCNPANGRLEGRRRFVGSTARFTCSSGYTMLGSAERVCTPSLQWTGDPATCKENCVPAICDIAAEHTCSIEKNSIETSCLESRARGLIDFAFSAFVNTSESQCTPNGKYAIHLRGIVEHFRSSSSNCSFLPDVLNDDVAEADFKHGCPCPLPRTSAHYLVTGACNNVDRTLTITPQSVFVQISEEVQRRAKVCGGR